MFNVYLSGCILRSGVVSKWVKNIVIILQWSVSLIIIVFLGID